MNKTELIEQVAKETEITKKAAEAAVNAVFEAIAKALENKEEVQVFGFGKFVVNERAAREGRNPATGEKITIAASKCPAFSASKALKDRVNG
ncbi:MAG: HU family DNA-binding protein [Clostridia bacterium]|nr:HU family DNA-binding protein [Clostridia bacterium]